MTTLLQPYPSTADQSAASQSTSFDLAIAYQRTQAKIRAQWRSGQRLDDVFANAIAIASALEAGQYGSSPGGLASGASL